MTTNPDQQQRCEHDDFDGHSKDALCACGHAWREHRGNGWGPCLVCIVQRSPGVDTPSPEPLRCPRDGETFDQHYEIGRRDGLAEAIAECDECAHRLAAHADGGCLVCSCRVPWRPEGVGGV